MSFGEVLKALNPFGVISEMYTNTLNYKLETIRLENEMEAMRIQANAINKKTDAEYQIKMELLSQRRDAFMVMLASYREEMGTQRIERREVLRLAQNAQEQAFRTDISVEQSRVFMEFSVIYIQQLHVFGDKASETLLKLVDSIPSGYELLAPRGNFLPHHGNLFLTGEGD